MDQAATSLRERIEELAKRAGSQRKLSLAAGLSGGYVSVLLARLRRDPDTGIDGAAALAIVKAMGVSVDWLLRGTEPRGESAALALPGNLRAALGTRPGRWPDVVVQQAALFAGLDDRDMSEEQWVDYLDALKREARRMKLELDASAPPAETRGVAFAGAAMGMLLGAVGGTAGTPEPPGVVAKKGRSA